MQDQKIERIKLGLVIDQKELELITFPKVGNRPELTLYKLRIMEGEIFDEIVDSLNLHAQEEELKNLENEYIASST